MKISYNWLKNYIATDLAPEEVAAILTDTGLEVEGVETVEAVKGGLNGVVVGHVLEKEKHPDADRLNITKVDVGAGEPLNIVCGAPNVDAGQKVLIATVGTTLYPATAEEGFKIKKSKIRGVESIGMICAEDELGLGDDHDGIMVLDDAAVPGTAASTYLKLENDYVFEIGLTPNRTDGMSHIGVARDLAAALQIKGTAIEYTLPSVKAFKIDNNDHPFEVVVEDAKACPRYAGLTIDGVKVGPSPEWLQDRLNAIGLSPINNVVDVTNFVLHEFGQPLHAFDGAKIKGNKVVVKQLAEGTKFTTLDETERSLSADDLMICNAEEGMCIAGVFGGIESGVTDSTTRVFLESAYFHPVSIRKSAKRHGLNTDASFRFERGVDPNHTITALKRAANLIKEVAGGSIASEIIDLYPEPIAGFEVTFSYHRCDRLIGKSIERETIKQILTALEIEIKAETDEGLTLLVPPYRADVTREADVIEEVLRIYGFNNVEIPTALKSSITPRSKPNLEGIRNVVANKLSANGYSEIMSNSLTKSEYCTIADAKQMNADYNVAILNPLSSELNVMRQSLLFSGLEAIVYNQNRQQEDLRFYEFGKVYQKFPDSYFEGERLALFITGRKAPESWYANDDKASFYQLKGEVNGMLQRLGIFKNLKVSALKSELFDEGLEYRIAKKKVVEMGWVKTSILKQMDLRQTEVLYAEIDWDAIIALLGMNKVKYKPVSKFPSVRRDLSMLLDRQVQFSDIEQLAFQCERNLLKKVDLFDIYEGKNLGEGKKSYAVSFIIQDENKTLNDKQIDKIMSKIQTAVTEKLGAVLR